MYGNVCHYMTMREQCMTIHDIMWQFMTGCANVWQCMTMYANAWAMYDRNGWQGIACRGSESQVPSLIDQTVTPGYSRSLFYFCYFFRILSVDNIWWHLGIPALYSTSALFLLTIFAKYYLVTLGYSHSVFYFGTFCCCKYLVTFRDFSALFSLLLPCVSFQALCCPFSKINLLVTASYSGCILVVPSDSLIQLTCDSCNFNPYTGSAFKYHQECHAYIRFLCYHRLIYN